MAHIVEFVPSGRGPARCPPDPDYPNGVDIHLAAGDQHSCAVDLPYPAPECGGFVVLCGDCGLSVYITAAGRPDDPRRVTLPCRAHHREGLA
jgi:hypothetical protein